MIAEVARLLHENKKKLPFGLYVTNSVQEEIGLRGAEMITQRIKPNIAIVTDVCHDTSTPMIDVKKQGVMSLERNFILFSSIKYSFPKVILNCRCIGNYWTFIYYIISLFLNINHGR
jgi:putative aminopeptidase FrvX